MKKLLPQEKVTVESYDNNAADWVSAHSNDRFWVDELAVFNKYLPRGKVLEIGSGGGRDAKELIKYGYDYTGTDISKGLIEQAKKYNPGATFLEMSVYDLDFPKNSFDGFWASAVLLHIPKSRIKAALEKIHSVIRKSGVGFISLKQGKGEQLIKEKLQSGNNLSRLFSFYEQEEFANLLKENGFEVIESKIRPMSEKTIWLVYFVKVIK